MVVIRAVQPSQTSWSLITYNWFNGQGPLVCFCRKKNYGKYSKRKPSFMSFNNKNRKLFTLQG